MLSSKGILNFFYNTGCLVLATTHYQELKNYALVTHGFENASSEFDVENLKPTYKLLIGIPGKSNAFAISKKLGLNQEILNNAYSLLKDETVNGTTKIELIRSFDRVLALDLLKKDEAKREDHDLIMKLIEKRNNAKKSKDYELADSIRDELYSKGIKLIDTREGTTYEEV